MTFFEAIHELKNGKIIGRPRNDYRLIFDGENLFEFKAGSPEKKTNVMLSNVPFSILFRDDYIIIEKP